MSARRADNSPLASRRSFLKTSTVLSAAGALAGSLAITRSAHAAGSDLLKVGLIGCGGRGTGAAAQALNADKNVQLTALGDVFKDKLDASLGNLRKQFEMQPDKIAAEPNCFIGFDAYQQVIASGVDVVLLCSPPHFRPQHLEAAVAAGKHIFAEKPVAVDAPGVRRILAASLEAERKGLSIVSGLCWRYEPAKRETVARIHDGAIGDVRAMQVSYNTGSLWMNPRKAEWSDMEWQMRNWMYFTWLSGDFNVEQHVHSLDKAAWVMHDVPPVKCTGLGGRQVRTGVEYGNAFDHMAVVYDYEDGTKLFATCRQQAGCAIDVSDTIIGTKGTANLLPRNTITGETKWRYDGPKGNMYQLEHDALFGGIRSGKPINNGGYMTTSTLLAIMGRMACYTGKEVTWKMALESQEDLTPEQFRVPQNKQIVIEGDGPRKIKFMVANPAKYEWGTIATPTVALPGITPFV